MSDVKHAKAFAPDGSRWMIPSYVLCMPGKEGRLAMDDDRVTCKRCLSRLATVPEGRPERNVWLAKHGVQRSR